MTCTVSGAIMLSTNSFIYSKSSPSTRLSHVLDDQFVVKYTPADCLTAFGETVKSRYGTCGRICSRVGSISNTLSGEFEIVLPHVG